MTTIGSRHDLEEYTASGLQFPITETRRYRAQSVSHSCYLAAVFSQGFLPVKHGREKNPPQSLFQVLQLLCVLTLLLY